MNPKEKERWADKKAGGEHGGNDVLAFAMCEARKKRKKRQGGPKLFFVLIFWLLLDQAKIAIAIMNTNKKTNY